MLRSRTTPLFGPLVLAASLLWPGTARPQDAGTPGLGHGDEWYDTEWLFELVGRPGAPPQEARFDGDSCLFMDLTYTRAPLFRVRTELRPLGAALGVEPSRLAHPPRHRLAAGALVLGSVPVRRQRCVYAAQPGGLESGVIADRHLERVEDPPTDAAAFAGEWVADDVPREGWPRSHVHVQNAAGGALHLRGEAYQCRDDACSDAFDASFDGEVTFSVDRVEGRDHRYDRHPDQGCWLIARMRGPFLVVNDNRQCGSTTFAGIYTRDATPAVDGG